MATVSTKSTAPDLQRSVPHRLNELVLGVGVKGWIYDTALSVTVPSITDLANGTDIGNVAVTVTGVALGDVVLAANPTVALPANCRLVSAYVSATDTVTFVFCSDGGSVTGAAKTFSVVVADLT